MCEITMMHLLVDHYDISPSLQLSGNAQEFRLEEIFSFLFIYKGIARTQSPTIKNDAPESPTFGVIANVSQTSVQWKGLGLEEPPS